MAEVSVKINNKSYGIACDDGQEERVRKLANFVNQRYQSIAQGGGAVNELQNLVLTSILLADELADVKIYARRLEEQANGEFQQEVQIKEVEVIREVEVIKEVPVEVIKEVPVAGAVSPQDVDQMAEIVMALTDRINQLSNKLAKAA